MPRRVTFYRLETGRTATVLVPDHGVLRKRTVQRLRDALGYRGGADSPLGVDCPQMVKRKPFGVEVVEPEVPPPDDLAPGSIALRFRPATDADAELLRRAIGRLTQPMDYHPAEQQAQKMLDAYDESEK